MAKPRYGAGDVVHLRDGAIRLVSADMQFRVLGLLPEAHGEIQYRVRADNEGFERRIPAGDIDVARSGASKQLPTVDVAKNAKEPWLNALSIKVRK